MGSTMLPCILSVSKLYPELDEGDRLKRYKRKS